MSPVGCSLHVSIKAELHTRYIFAPKIFYTAPAVYEQDRRSANSSVGERIPNSALLKVLGTYLLFA